MFFDGITQLFSISFDVCENFDATGENWHIFVVYIFICQSYWLFKDWKTRKKKTNKNPNKRFKNQPRESINDVVKFIPASTLVSENYTHIQVMLSSKTYERPKFLCSGKRINLRTRSQKCF